MLQIVKTVFRFQHGFVVGFVLALMLVFSAVPAAHAAPAQLTASSPMSVDAVSASLTQVSREQAVHAFGVEDYVRAYKLLLPLAATGDVVAQYYLASLFDAGLGIERNAAEAAYWYRHAAVNGHIDSQYNLGVAYSRGDGVERDMSDAARWWRAAARRGSLNAQFNLGIVYMHGRGVTADAGEAMRWWGMAAAQGDPASQYNLGTLYANGEGVEQDYERARLWWTRAAAQGFEQAIEALDQIKSARQ
jgi:TPR repeat protein